MNERCSGLVNKLLKCSNVFTHSLVHHDRVPVHHITGDQAPEDSAAWGLGQETFSASMETATPLTLGHPTADHPMPNCTQIKTCGVSGRMPANLRHKLASLKVRSSSPSPGITARVIPRVERKVLVHPRRRQGMEAKPCNQPASHKPQSIISHSISGTKSQCLGHKKTPY